jgi:hypothetical protein
MRAIPVPATTGEWRVLRDRLTTQQPAPPTRPFGWPLGLAGVLLIAAIVLGGAQLRARTTRQESIAVGGTPSVAIVGISTTGDSTRGWLREGLAQMMAATLSRTTAVEVVAPKRVRQIVARAQLDVTDHAT